MIDPIGKPPVNLMLFIAAKLAVLGCFLFPLAKIFDQNITLYDGSINKTIAGLLLVTGLIVAVAALITLGKSTSIGLPAGETKLKTGGLYRFSRNPLYMGGFILCLAYCFFAVNIINFILATVGIIIHHRIVLAEEEYLSNKFPDQWQEYKNRVGRYL